MFTANVALKLLDDGETGRIRMFRNNEAYKDGAETRSPLENIGRMALPFSAVANVAAGQTFDMYVFHDHGSNLDTDGRIRKQWFQIYCP